LEVVNFYRLRSAGWKSPKLPVPLELRGNSIPAHKHGRAQALQNLLFFLSEGSTVEMNRHPFFVFGKRRVGLLEIAEFPRFVRRTRCVGEECPEFGCFGCSCAPTLPTISKPCLGLTASGSSHTKMAENIDGALLALLRRPTAINVRAVIRPETMPPTSKPHKSRG
jgi:hypothetical protein